VFLLIILKIITILTILLLRTKNNTTRACTDLILALAFALVQSRKLLAYLEGFELFIGRARGSSHDTQNNKITELLSKLEETRREWAKDFESRHQLIPTEMFECVKDIFFQEVVLDQVGLNESQWEDADVSEEMLKKLNSLRTDQNMKDDVREAMIGKFTDMVQDEEKWEDVRKVMLQKLVDLNLQQLECDLVFQEGCTNFPKEVEAWLEDDTYIIKLFEGVQKPEDVSETTEKKTAKRGRNTDIRRSRAIEEETFPELPHPSLSSPQPDSHIAHVS
jgi:hypothetical protein